MSKKRLLTIIGVLAVLLLALAISDPVMDAFASNAKSEPKRGALPGANEAGMKIYQQSERADYGRFNAKSNAEGWAIYRDSERSSYPIEPAVANEEGWAIYRESERADYGRFTAKSNAEGLAIYHQSERFDAAAPPQRLFNGKPFNAYQRSEWLGAER